VVSTLPIVLHSQDTSIAEILEFFDKAEREGHNIMSVIGPQVDVPDELRPDISTHNVAFEARQLKMLFLKLFY